VPLPDSSDLQAAREYVITQPVRSGVPIDHALRHYPTVRLLEQVDNQTALVEMTPDVRDWLADRHPEFCIEPNIRYEARAWPSR